MMDLFHKPLFQWNLIDYALFTGGFLILLLGFSLLFDRITRKSK